MQFLRHQILHIENVLQVRCRFCRDSFLSAVQTARAGIPSANLQEDGKIAFSLIEDAGADYMADLYIPLNGALDSPPCGYMVKPKIYLTNAVKTRHEGNLFCIQDSITLLEQYIKKMDLLQITGNYNVIVFGLSDPADPQNAIVDIYIGVSGNVL